MMLMAMQTAQSALASAAEISFTQLSVYGAGLFLLGWVAAHMARPQDEGTRQQRALDAANEEG